MIKRKREHMYLFNYFGRPPTNHPSKNNLSTRFYVTKSTCSARG